MSRIVTTIRHCALFVAAGLLIVGATGRSRAYGQGGPNPQITVAPAAGLTGGQTVQVWGTGFQSNQAINLIECGAEVMTPPFRGAICGDDAVGAQADADGNFGPVSFTVAASIAGSRWEKGHTIPATHTCEPTADCYIHAYSLTRGLRSANQHLDFIE